MNRQPLTPASLQAELAFPYIFVRIENKILDNDIANIEIPANKKVILIYNCEINAFPKLHNNITLFRIDRSNINIQIPTLSDKLDELIISNSHLETELPSIPENVTNLHLEKINITKIPSLPKTIYNMKLKNLTNLEPQYKLILDRINNIYKNKEPYANFIKNYKIVSDDLKLLNSPKYKGEQVAAIETARIPQNASAIASSFISGVSGKSLKQQKIMLREEATRPEGGPGVGGRRRKRKTRRRNTRKIRRFNA